MDFQSSPPFESSKCFYMTITGYFERFQYFNFEVSFWKTKTCFERLEHCFINESTKIENVIFSYKTNLSEANFKANRMESSKWQKTEFCSNYFICQKLLYFFENLISV